MAHTFFSWELRWKHVIAVSCIVALAMLIMGILCWYCFLYLPMVHHLAENQSTNERMQTMQQLRRSNGSPTTTTTTSP